MVCICGDENILFEGLRVCQDLHLFAAPRTAVCRKHWTLFFFGRVKCIKTPSFGCGKIGIVFFTEALVGCEKEVWHPAFAAGERASASSSHLSHLSHIIPKLCDAVSLVSDFSPLGVCAVTNARGGGGISISRNRQCLVGRSLYRFPLLRLPKMAQNGSSAEAAGGEMGAC